MQLMHILSRFKKETKFFVVVVYNIILKIEVVSWCCRHQ